MTSPSTRHPALYRVYQFFVAVKASWFDGAPGRLTAKDKDEVATILATPTQRALFKRMSPNDQRHALAVARSLQQRGDENSALLQAALLHDVAKCLGQPIIHRVLIVLFEAFWPAALEGLAKLEPSQNIESSSWWRRPFVIHAQHPAIGAEWAEAAGCDPVAVRLIARHQDKLTGQVEAEERLLAALQWADNLN